MTGLSNGAGESESISGPDGLEEPTSLDLNELFGGDVSQALNRPLTLPLVSPLEESVSSRKPLVVKLEPSGGVSKEQETRRREVESFAAISPIPSSSSLLTESLDTIKEEGVNGGVTPGGPSITGQGINVGEAKVMGSKKKQKFKFVIE
jgi:hypothetical protein